MSMHERSSSTRVLQELVALFTVDQVVVTIKDIFCRAKRRIRCSIQGDRRTCKGVGHCKCMKWNSILKKELVFIFLWRQSTDDCNIPGML